MPHLGYFLLYYSDSAVNLSLHLTQCLLESTGVIGLHLADKAQDAVMTAEDFAGTFELTILTDQFRLHTFIHNVRKKSFYAFVELAVAAVVDARDLLNATCTSVGQGLIERVLFAAVVFIASDSNSVHFSLLVVAQFFRFESLPTVRNGACCAFL